MKTYRFVTPAIAALFAVAMSPAWADHDEDGHERSDKENSAEAAHQHTAPADADALPGNDLSTSMGSKISSPTIASGSLHASPKILNNAGLSNDLKATLQPDLKPAIAPSASGDPVAAPAQAVKTPAPTEAAVPTPNTFDLEVAPQGEASLPEAGAQKAAEAPARAGGLGSLLPLIGGVSLALVGGFFASRLIGGRSG